MGRGGKGVTSSVFWTFSPSGVLGIFSLLPCRLRKRAEGKKGSTWIHGGQAGQMRYNEQNVAGQSRVIDDVQIRDQQTLAATRERN
jgi:hypothetical protein